ncbi:MAG: PH domain-containing protein [Oscillospiraceae bacterium]|nr:PH domain-containing protein [Oscillospiraceae bacterium]
MEAKHISRRALLLWRVRLCAAALPLSFLLSLLLEPFSLLWSIFAGILILAFLFFYSFYFPVKYKKLTYAVGRGILVVHGGVFYRTRRSISLANIQYLSSFETPLCRLLGVSGLLIHAAGGTLYLPALEKQTCALLSSALTPDPGEAFS